jgi:hypothetical protein
MYHNSRFLILFISTIQSLSTWEPAPQITLKGILNTTTQKSIIHHSQGNEEYREKKHAILIPTEPIIISRSIIIGTRPPIDQWEAVEWLQLSLPEEFESLLGKEVELHGHFEEAGTRLSDNVHFHVSAAIDTKQQHPASVVFYEPCITELTGTLYQKLYPGPPGYLNVEDGDAQEFPLFLILADPVDVLLAKPEEEPFNQPEIGVREIQIVFSKEEPPVELWKRGITVKGTLFSAHTGHHRRRVVMMANSWKVISIQQEKKKSQSDILALDKKNRSSYELQSHAIYLNPP